MPAEIPCGTTFEHGEEPSEEVIGVTLHVGYLVDECCSDWENVVCTLEIFTVPSSNHHIRPTSNSILLQSPLQKMDNLVATTEPLAMASLLQTYLDEISFIDMLTKLYKRKQELVYKIMPTLLVIRLKLNMC
jgi:hypothetical protein